MSNALRKMNLARSNLRATINLIDDIELGQENEDMVDGLSTQLHRLNSKIKKYEAQLREEERNAA